jgi:hypothetical protein
MHYTSSVNLLGLPLVHIAIGPAPGSQATRGIAKGWIAIGDVAIGAVAIGGLALGGLSLGGLSVGALAIGGAAVGTWSIGGLAVAFFAFGGAAFGLIAATGGLAVAVEYAIGGLAVAAHANDEIAANYFSSGLFFRYTDTMKVYFEWLVGAAVAIWALTWAFGRNKRDVSPRG